MHYARYDKKKSRSKGGKPKTSQSSSSRNSQSSQGADRPTCYRCRKPWFKGHIKSCPAINVKCHKCGITGHYNICCKKTGNFPKKATSTFKKQHIAASHNPEDLYYDEDGHVRQKSSVHMLSTTRGKKELMIEFGCGEDMHSIDQKITLKVDTGADVNAINKTTFQRLFPNKKLNPSTVILENFDSTCIKPMGRFKCFLRWKGKKDQKAESLKHHRVHHQGIHSLHREQTVLPATAVGSHGLKDI